MLDQKKKNVNQESGLNCGGGGRGEGALLENRLDKSLKVASQELMQFFLHAEKLLVSLVTLYLNLRWEGPIRGSAYAGVSSKQGEGEVFGGWWGIGLSHGVTFRS